MLNTRTSRINSLFIWFYSIATTISFLNIYKKYFWNCLYFEWLCCFNQTSEFTSFLWLTISKVKSIIHCAIIPCTIYLFSICFKLKYFKIMGSTDPIKKPSSNLCQLSYILKTIIKFQKVTHKRKKEIN